ncbi:MAG: IMPACT family protein [Thermoanaerobaculia bacterium]
MPEPAAGYRVLAATTTAEVREKGSRFLAVVAGATDSAEAGAVRDQLAREHAGASHHCWAERIGWPPAERWSDAGEPRGAAGEPIVRVLRAREISDVVAVVVRWFGGTKLGKGGLARAYSASVVAALENGSFGRRHATSMLRLRMPYERIGAVKRLVRSGDVEWVDEDYGTGVTVTLRVRIDRIDALREALANLHVEVELFAGR